MKLTQFSLLVLFVTFSFNFTIAQEKEEDLTHGINIYLFNGYAAGYRFNECENSFWRINLDLYSNYSNSTNNSGSISVNMSNVDTVSTENKRDENHMSLSLTPEYLFKFYQTKFVDIYTGGGILIGYNRDESKSTSQRSWNTNAYDYQYTVYNGYSIGLIGVLGVEAKLTENFYVFVESQLSGTRSWMNGSGNSTTVNNGVEQYRSDSTNKTKAWYANFVLSRAGIVY